METTTLEKFFIDVDLKVRKVHLLLYRHVTRTAPCTVEALLYVSVGVGLGMLL